MSKKIFVGCSVRLRQIFNVTAQYFRRQRNIIAWRPFFKSCHSIPKLKFRNIGTLSSFSFGFGQANTKKENELNKEDTIIAEADRLYTNNEIAKLYDFLVEHKAMKNDEILWRLARAACDKGKRAQSDTEKRELFFEAFNYVKQALEINPDNYASHKWYAILLDYTGEFEGTKQRISNAFLVKEHFMKAIELNPTDATSIYSLGYWCFLFADMPWYQRKIASAVFATPPTSTYEEALMYFEKAEETDPNFYSMNLLMLGKTHIRLKNYKMALNYLTKAKEYPVLTPDDQQAHKEAVELLKSIGVKLEDK